MAGFKVSTGGGRGGRRGKHRTVAEINVTPLVDVMLVLLVIFMVTAPMLTSGVNVDLPQASAGPVHEDDQAPIEISLDPNGGMFVGEQKVTRDKLVDILKNMTKDNPERRIFIRADKGLSYGQVMGTLGLLNEQGFKKVSLITQPSDKAP